MTTHNRYRFIGDAMVLAYLLNALFAILLAALLLFLLTYMGWPTEDSYSRHWWNVLAVPFYLRPTRLPGNPSDDFEVFDSNRRAVGSHHAASADAGRSAVVLDDNRTGATALGL